VLWPTTMRFENHWNRAEMSTASSSRGEFADQHTWPGEWERRHASTAQLAEPVDFRDARILLAASRKKLSP